jgi:membrane protein
MKLLNRTRANESEDDTLEPQRERDEPKLDDPSPADRSKRGYFAILKRAVKGAGRDHITNLAAALAYYAFLAIPSALLLAAGLFGLLAGPNAVDTVMNKAATLLPKEVTSLLHDSLTRLTQKQGTSLTLIVVGGVLAFWSLSGAMQNLMWALNITYERDETRGFVRRRLTAFAMVIFLLLAFALVFGLLVLGPHLTRWIGDAVGSQTAVRVVWWTAQWPILIGGLLLAFAVVLYLGPNVDQRRWRFISLGSVVALVIWLVASGAFAYYASKFGSFNKAWGSLAAVVIMLTWLWLSSLALLFGAEVNAEADRSREPRSAEPAERELQASRTSPR